MSKKYQFDEEEKQWLTYHTKNSLYILLKKERERTKNLQSQLDQANEKIMWLNAEIDTLKSEKENLMRTLEEAEKKLQELRGGK